MSKIMDCLANSPVKISEKIFYGLISVVWLLMFSLDCFVKFPYTLKEPNKIHTLIIELP